MKASASAGSSSRTSADNHRSPRDRIRRFQGDRLPDGTLPESKSLIFEARLPADGRYEVRLAYSPGSNRAASTPVRVEHAGGTAVVMVNQKQKPPIAPA
jgi:hypothetical protein